jgi:hypothetical protein
MTETLAHAPGLGIQTRSASSTRSNETKKQNTPSQTRGGRERKRYLSFSIISRILSQFSLSAIQGAILPGTLMGDVGSGVEGRPGLDRLLSFSLPTFLRGINLPVITWRQRSLCDFSRPVRIVRYSRRRFTIENTPLRGCEQKRLDRVGDFPQRVRHLSVFYADVEVGAFPVLNLCDPLGFPRAVLVHSHYAHPAYETLHQYIRFSASQSPSMRLCPAATAKSIADFSVDCAFVSMQYKPFDMSVIDTSSPTCFWNRDERDSLSSVRTISISPSFPFGLKILSHEKYLNPRTFYEPRQNRALPDSTT